MYELWSGLYSTWKMKGGQPKTRGGTIPHTSTRRPMEGSTLFITGMQRSGTTLLDKLLGCHSSLSLLSQPFPLLFIETKRDFLHWLGRSDVRYPLGHLFLEDRYRPEDFARYLTELRIEGSRLAQLFEEMRGFSGQYTRFSHSILEHVIPQLPSGDFAMLLVGLYRALAPMPQAPIVGGKETICEEFLPYLLGRGCRCLLILRDPRDVVASLNYGRGPEYGGQLKPTLFNVRNWRKSVAYALELEDHPGFLWLRYEDLVMDPLAALRRIAQTLGVEPSGEELLTDEIRDPAGHVWTSNSSHGERRGVSSASVGAYRKVLPPTVARFIEAACLPELRLLGYPTDLDATDAPVVLRSFEEPYEITREGMSEDATGPANAALEIRRLELLAELPSAATIPYTLFESAHAKLGKAFNGWGRCMVKR